MFAPSRKDHGQPRPSALGEPFGLQIMSASTNELSAKWGALQSRLRSDEATLAMCRSDENECPAAARAFLQIIEQGRTTPGPRPHRRDQPRGQSEHQTHVRLVQHGIDDVWSAPLATFATGAGDCEDYAIAKYLALRKSGTVADDLRLMIVRDIRRGVAHAVVAVRFDGEWLILDNRHLALVSAAEVPHYSPLFVLDHRGVGEFMTAGLRR